jgi:hypothetical protein
MFVTSLILLLLTRIVVSVIIFVLKMGMRKTDIFYRMCLFVFVNELLGLGS